MEAIIYKIICETTGDIYIGSSKNGLVRPFRVDHEFYQNHIKNNCKVSVEEKFEYKSKEDILWKEREWIEKTECINKIRPIISVQERKEMRKKAEIKYYEINKEEKKRDSSRRVKYKRSWGDERFHNCLLKIDPFLFT